MSDIAIKVEGIGKRYTIGRKKSGEFRETFGNLLRSFKPSAGSHRPSANNDFWALKDISFEIKQGEAVGIIGRNGAGKSTLLKVLSRITKPTTGRFEINGRVSSLLEVGTGFHPELTGRENIYLNGTILGMRRAEIKAKFDEIIAFSGVEDFIDTPVKHYSSGMKVRLAFSVAAHLEPEILIIDEVLAVGDAEFQKKCLGKMEDVTGEGRTVLFVSHNLPSLKTLCKGGMLLENGNLIYNGNIVSAIDRYITGYHTTGHIIENIKYYRNTERISHIAINNSTLLNQYTDSNCLDIFFDIEFTKKIAFEFQLHLKKNDVVIGSYSKFVKEESFVYKPGIYTFHYKFHIPEIRSGKYTLDLCFAEAFVGWLATIIGKIQLEIVNSQHNTFINNDSLNWWGPVLLNAEFTYGPVQNPVLYNIADKTE
jgi:ABC-type polysaccharide/polyol phosphate transport system ATPase subunit